MQAIKSLQSGGVLVIGLLVLLVVTLLVLATMSLPAVEIKMAHNVELQTQALVIAEDTLNVGEREIVEKYNNVPTFDFDQDSKDCLYNKPDNGLGASREHWCSITGTAPHSGAYYVEYLGSQPLEFGNGSTMTERYYFQVIGQGQVVESVRQIQVTFATPVAKGVN